MEGGPKNQNGWKVKVGYFNSHKNLLEGYSIKNVGGGWKQGLAWTLLLLQQKRNRTIGIYGVWGFKFHYISSSKRADLDGMPLAHDSGADPQNLSRGAKPRLGALRCGCARPEPEGVYPPGDFSKFNQQMVHSGALWGLFCPLTGALYVISPEIWGTFVLQLGHFTVFSPQIGGTLYSSIESSKLIYPTDIKQSCSRQVYL